MSSETAFKDRWNEYLELFDNDKKDIYFTEEYIKLQDSGEDRAICFVFREDEKVLLFPILKRSIAIAEEESFDFETPYGYGGPICNVENASFIQKAMAEFDNHAIERNIVAGFVRFHPLLNNHAMMRERHKVLPDRNTVYMDLTLTKEQIWNEQVHSKHRNVIRKAEQCGVQYLLDEKFEYLNEFIEIYYQTMERLDSQEFYFFDRDYFIHLKERLAGNAFLGLAMLEGRVIAGAIFFHYGPYGHYHLSGSREEYLGYYPNNFMIYNTALSLKDKNVKCFHLGGGTDGSPENSLYKFKKRFSRAESCFYIGKMIFDGKRYESLCRVWDDKNPDKKDNYRNIHLKYRY